MTTRLGDEIDGGLHAISGDQRPRVARMAWLSARVAPTPLAATSFARSAGEPIGGRRLRRGRRVLLSQSQLTFQVDDLFLGLCDLLGLFRDLSIAFGQFTAKPFHLVLQTLLSVFALPSLGPRHAPHGTPIGSICTGP